MRRLLIVVCVVALVTPACGKIKELTSGGKKQPEGAAPARGTAPAASGSSPVSSRGVSTADGSAVVPTAVLAELPPEVTQPVARIPDGGALPMPAREEKIFAQPQNQFPLVEDLGNNELKMQAEEYLRQRGWKLGYSPSNPGHSYIGWGQADIYVEPDDIRFGQARLLAFEKAFLEAKGEFAKTQGRLAEVESIRRFFQDDRDFDPSAIDDQSSWLEVIKEKVEALTEAKLDQALNQAGVDPGEFAGRPPAQKRKLLEDSISKAVTLKAIQSVSGMRVQATFEDLHGVGVLVVYSEKMRAIANAVARGCSVSGGGAIDPRDSILSQIERAAVNGDVDFITMHGVRVLIDENGDRALVAFGQSSPKIRVGDSKIKTKAAVNAARMTAQDMASAALTEFLNSSVVYESDSLRAEVTERNEVISREFMEETEGVNIGETIDRLIKSHARVRLAGEVNLKQWAANHPETGHPIYGHILMWSPTTQALATGKRPTAKRVPSGQPAPTPQNKVHQSPEFEDDF